MIFTSRNSEEKEKTEEKEEKKAKTKFSTDVDLRLIGIVGDIDEEKTAEIIYSMLLLSEQGRVEVKDEDGEVKVGYEPMEFLISSYGGSSHEMFAMYDVMRQIRDRCHIHTIGMGKVMSAGVLLLAAGTKGQRLIGQNCRVMLHSVLGGHAGSLHNLENEMEEIRWTQEQYIDALVKETKMTKRQLKRLLSKKVNIYLNAEEAVKYGIADQII